MASPSSQYTVDMNHYLGLIKKIPLLTEEEEHILAKQWREKGDRKAIDRLLESHLRLVAKIAGGYRGYGLPLSDLIAEGNLGMMQAIKHFDPGKGFRFSTYALWWIKASIQEYILRSWSLVKLGTTSAQKRLFFNLRRMKREAPQQNNTQEDLTPEMAKHIAAKLGVKEAEVYQMNCRLGGDYSLNISQSQSGGEGESEWIEWLADEDENQEMKLIQHDEMVKRHKLLETAMHVLNERERHIFIDRRLTEPPFTLEALSEKYGISRERVRQIEVHAFERLQKIIRNIIRAQSLSEI